MHRELGCRDDLTLDHGLTNARSEAINTHPQALTKRAYGFHSPHTLVAMALLTRDGLCPPLPGRAAGNRARGNASRFATCGNTPGHNLRVGLDYHSWWAKCSPASGSVISLAPTGPKPRQRRADRFSLGGHRDHCRTTRTTNNDPWRPAPD
ncbi:MAG TPA: transposase [Mycobacterium sp.]|nr:transposase [Mycobacterium sp.]